MALQIFFSYTHEDSRFTMRLARDCRRQGLAVWLDQWNIRPDVGWDKAIERAVKTSSHFLIVLSPAAINSWVVRDQFILASRTGRTIIPVLYQPCDFPPVLSKLSNVIDFTGPNYRASLRQLLAHYFPSQSVQLEYRTRPAWGDLAWSWRYDLLPLLTSLVARHGGVASQGMQAVLPNRALETEYETKSVGAGDPTPEWLQKLLFLLWPGWLGPLLLSGLLIIATYFYWADRQQPAPPAAILATLEVVQPTATPELLPTPIRTNIRAKDGKILVFIPAGEFVMGSTPSNSQAEDDETPQRRVYLDPFWIDKTEITNVQYRLCVDEGVCSPHRNQGSRFEDDHQPVVGVDWFQADTYCRWSGGRLPTEAEWEKAARGIDGRAYPWGDTFDGTRLNSCDVNCMADWKNRRIDDGYGFTAPVGNYPSGASPYGVLDMSGNVWEWTADWYDANYYQQAPSENPAGPPTGEQRVVRGGSWFYDGKNLRVSNRHRDIPTYRYDNIGFRCVVDAVEN